MAVTPGGGADDRSEHLLAFIVMIAMSDGGLPWVRRSLDVEALLARRSVFLFGPRQTGKTTWVRRQLSGTVAITFSS